MAQWYQWIVFLHVLGVFAFLGTHGVVSFVIFRVRGEKELAALQTLLGLSASASIASMAALLVLLIFGIWAAFIEGWWAFGWPWATLGALVVIWGAMSGTSGREMRKLREAAGFTSGTKIGAEADPAAVVGAQEKVNPWPSAIIGGVGLLFILWLMVLKPF